MSKAHNQFNNARVEETVSVEPIAKTKTKAVTTPVAVADPIQQLMEMMAKQQEMLTIIASENKQLKARFDEIEAAKAAPVVTEQPAPPVAEAATTAPEVVQAPQSVATMTTITTVQVPTTPASETATVTAATPTTPASETATVTAATPTIPAPKQEEEEDYLNKSKKTSRRGAQQCTGGPDLSDTITSSDFLWGVGTGLGVTALAAAGIYWYTKD